MSVPDRKAIMIHVDRYPGVQLVTDPGPVPVEVPASTVARDDVIAIPFIGYGDLLCTVTNVHDRGSLIDVTVEESGLSHTTVFRHDANIKVYPAKAAGSWLR